MLDLVVVPLEELALGRVLGVVKSMQTEDTVGEDVCEVLAQQFRMVEHAVERVEVLSDHKEVQRRLKLELAQGSFEPVQIGENLRL